jgi:Uma2 family endonuclease
MHAVAEALSYEEYLALAEKSDELLEYHDGVVVAMVAPSFTHARILSQLDAELVVWLRARESTCVAYGTGLKVRVEQTKRTLIPDLTVVCGPAEHSDVDAQAVTNPVVVFEVLSPGTEDYDQGRKAQQYRRIASLREYVTVAQDRRFASIYRRAGDLWVLQDVEADGVLKLESLAFELPLERIYCDANGVIVE